MCASHCRVRTPKGGFTLHRMKNTSRSKVTSSALGDGAGPVREFCDRGTAPVEDQAGQKNTATGTEMTQALDMDMNILPVKEKDMKTVTKKRGMKKSIDTKRDEEKGEEIFYTPDKTSQWKRSSTAEFWEEMCSPIRLQEEKAILETLSEGNENKRYYRRMSMEHMSPEKKKTEREECRPAKKSRIVPAAARIHRI
ncbi:hypothetical protein WA026_017484 [Henosepilachna vigintioctopunctata]|uniref:Uncharacterized protein n=1 Tax=Henosepilachna vigintioctopunctata TaxID=420089 RepID=A0AAW1USV1_9CUCU